MAGSITSATAILMLSVTDLYTIPQQIEGYAADDVFSTDSLNSAEVVMGVDGLLSGGFTNVAVVQRWTLQANSPSIPIFDNWWLNQQINQEVFNANAIITLPSLGQKWILTKGFLTGYQPIPDAKKILSPRQFGITWEKVRPAPA